MRIASLAEAGGRESWAELIITDHHEMKVGLDGLLPQPRRRSFTRDSPGSAYPFEIFPGLVRRSSSRGPSLSASGSDKVAPELREFLLDAVTRGTRVGRRRLCAAPRREPHLRPARSGANSHEPLDRPARASQSGRGSQTPRLPRRTSATSSPRLNAAGRLGWCVWRSNCSRPPPGKAAELAQFLETQNGQRQALERKITQHAKEIVDRDFAKDAAVVVGAADWHPGVVGIVASRLVDHYGKPALVIAMPENKDKDAIATGSGRSIPGFALHTALHACDEMLEGHGGHAAAAGFKVRPDRIVQFRNRFNAYVASHFPSGTPAPRLVLMPKCRLSAHIRADERPDKLELYGRRTRSRSSRGGVDGETPRLIGTGDEEAFDFRVRQGDTVMRWRGTCPTVWRN